MPVKEDESLEVLKLIDALRRWAFLTGSYVSGERVIPVSSTMWPRNLREETLNIHLSG
jgi:hypothetical protein